MIMVMTTVTRMTTDVPPLLGLIWLASPALPVGGFSYSEGLESAIEHGFVHDETSCSNWLTDQLWVTQARGDLAVVAQAMPAWASKDRARLFELTHWVTSTRESAEMRLQTLQMGKSMLEWLRNLQQADPEDLDLLAQLPATYPLAQALALTLTQAPLDQALQACAFAWAENMTQAALKAVPLGQTDGQRILLALGETLPGMADAALAMADDEPGSFAPGLAIAASRHETQYSRLFRS